MRKHPLEKLYAQATEGQISYEEYAEQVCAETSPSPNIIKDLVCCLEHLPDNELRQRVFEKLTTLASKNHLDGRICALFESLVRVYRWLSKEERKLLDALQKKHFTSIK